MRARARKLVRAWNARACGARCSAAADGRFDRIVAQHFKTLRSSAVEATVRGFSGSQIARARAPCEH
eukprot:123911-Lingulodinium_polyedra.AAC.1